MNAELKSFIDNSSSEEEKRVMVLVKVPLPKRSIVNERTKLAPLDKADLAVLDHRMETVKKFIEDLKVANGPHRFSGGFVATVDSGSAKKIVEHAHVKDVILDKEGYAISESPS